MVDALLDKIGYLMFFNMMSLFTAISFTLLQFFSHKKFVPDLSKANTDVVKIGEKVYKEGKIPNQIN
jgi:hypothetical protein